MGSAGAPPPSPRALGALGALGTPRPTHGRGPKPRPGLLTAAWCPLKRVPHVTITATHGAPEVCDKWDQPGKPTHDPWNNRPPTARTGSTAGNFPQSGPCFRVGRPTRDPAHLAAQPPASRHT